MINESQNFDLQANKNHFETNTLGEIKLKAGEKISLVDDRVVYVKVKSSDGKIGFVPLSLVSKTSEEQTSTDKLTCMVIWPYQKAKKDELSLNIGEMADIKAFAEDGWCYVKSSGKLGWIPLNHLTPLFQSLNFYKRYYSSIW